MIFIAFFISFVSLNRYLPFLPGSSVFFLYPCSHNYHVNAIVPPTCSYLPFELPCSGYSMGFFGQFFLFDVSCTFRKRGYYIDTAAFLLMSINVLTNKRIRNKYVIPATANLLFPHSVNIWCYECRCFSHE